MSDYISPKNVFPRLHDNLLLVNYPAIGRKTFVRIENIQISDYEVAADANVTSADTSAFSENKLNNLIPLDGHLYLVIPTINPEQVVFTLTAPATGAANAIAVSDNDCNTRVVGVSNNTTTVILTVQESCRLMLNMPATVPWWGVDALSTGGSVDWLQSSPEAPNASYMFAITDTIKQGTIQFQWQMPANNVAATLGMQPRARFYIAFIEYCPLTEEPDHFTPVPCWPPSQGTGSAPAISAQIKSNPRIVQ